MITRQLRTTATVKIYSIDWIPKDYLDNTIVNIKHINSSILVKMIADLASSYYSVNR